MLDENARWLRPAQARRHTSSLNDPNADIIATEWEIAVLNSLNKFGTVEHEPPIARTPPDILFRPAIVGDSGFVADITAVSDKGLHAKNPIEAVSEELCGWAHKLHLQGVKGGLSLNSTKREGGAWRDGPDVNLAIPATSRFPEQIFNSDFAGFFEGIIAEPNEMHSFRPQGANLEITFDPIGEGVSGGYPGFTLPRSTTRNRPFYALEEKAAKLKGAASDGPLGIVLCDGDCDVMRTLMSDWATYGLRDIVLKFFTVHPYIAFVYTLSVKTSGNGNLSPRFLSYDARLWLNPAVPPIAPELVDLFQKLPTKLPVPMRTPYNARPHIEWCRKNGKCNESRTFYGGLTVAGTEIKLSSRAVHELLAGKLSQSDFAAQFEHLAGGNPFQRMMQEGRLIQSISVERSDIPEDDDEWLLFEFGEPDPAVMPYAYRPRKNSGSE